MSATTYVISDTHFNHANILTFRNEAGALLRPEFSCVEEMDETMVERWNKVVRPQDKVYHLGDVTMKAPGLGILKRLNGHKRLVRGNHDIFKTKQYMQYFEEIYGVRVLEDMIFSHIPLHADSIKERWLANVHGHTHNNHPQGFMGSRYYNVSVEMIDYTPISLEELKQRIRAGQPYVQSAPFLSKKDISRLLG